MKKFARSLLLFDWGSCFRSPTKPPFPNPPPRACHHLPAKPKQPINVTMRDALVSVLVSHERGYSRLSQGCYWAVVDALKDDS